MLGDAGPLWHLQNLPYTIFLVILLFLTGASSWQSASNNIIDYENVLLLKV